MKEPVISIILTFHAEGLLAHKTILAVQRSAKKLDAEGIPYEIIVHIDNGDNPTKQYFKKYQDNEKYHIFHNSFGEPAKSRNFAVKQSKGKYLTLIDGDDLISENWLYDGYKILQKSKKPMILHPEIDLTFGIDSEIRMWRMRNSFSKDKDTLILFGRNRWCAGTYLTKEVALKYPYVPAVNGFGYEDWHFNSMTRGDGVIHNIIPGAILFHRIKPNSTYLTHIAEKTVTAYADTFSTDNMRRIAKTLSSDKKITHPEAKITKADILRLGHKIAKKIPVARLFAKRVAERHWHKSYRARIESLPDFLIPEWRKMNKIENCIYPAQDIIARMPTYDSDTDYLGRVYCQIISHVRKDPDYLFIPPLLSVGGTEKVIVNYLNAFAEIHPDWHIVVLSTLAKNHNYNIPNNVDFVDFDGIVSELPDYDKDFLLSRFIIQTKVKRLHIINNSFAYNWARDHERLLVSNGYIVNVSHFMHEFSIEPDHVYSFADPLIREIYPSLNKIFTDNESVIEEVLSNNAFDPKKFSVHYQPVQLNMHDPISRTDHKDRPVRILWASRVSQQKRPDILKQIANLLPSDKYQIDVYGRFQEPYHESFFRDTPNITYKGYYNDINQLPAKEYDLFLYTSQTDGLPNILLEISSLGLPIVASDVGGVKDFIINHKTGLTVKMDDIKGYKEAIDYIINHPKSAEKYVRSAQDLILDRHSEKKFLAKVKKDIP